MPVTVKELILKFDVKGNSSPGKEQKAPVGGGGGLSKLDKEVIIREAIRRVMEELEYKFGR